MIPPAIRPKGQREWSVKRTTMHSRENRSLDERRWTDTECERYEALLGGRRLRTESDCAAEYRLGCGRGACRRRGVRRHAHFARRGLILTRVTMHSERQR